MKSRVVTCYCGFKQEYGPLFVRDLTADWTLCPKCARWLGNPAPEGKKALPRKMRIAINHITGRVLFFWSYEPRGLILWASTLTEHGDRLKRVYGSLDPDNIKNVSSRFPENVFQDLKSLDIGLGDLKRGF